LKFNSIVACYLALQLIFLPRWSVHRAVGPWRFFSFLPSKKHQQKKHQQKSLRDPALRKQPGNPTHNRYSLLWHRCEGLLVSVRQLGSLIPH